MTFLEDTAWPQGLLNIFNIGIQGSTLENRYYGPFDKLLNYCFGDSFSYYVFPQSPPVPSTHESLDFAVFLIVYTERVPVLIVEIKNEDHINSARLRYQADLQMRDRYDFLLDPEICKVPRLYGLSCLGTKTRIYRGEIKDGRGVVFPDVVHRPYNNMTLPSDFLRGEWDLDLLSPEGFKQMQQIVREIKNQ